MPHKSSAFFLSESMKIWKSDILTLFSKSDYNSPSRIDKVEPFPMHVYTNLKSNNLGTVRPGAKNKGTLDLSRLGGL